MKCQKRVGLHSRSRIHLQGARTATFNIGHRPENRDTLFYIQSWAPTREPAYALRHSTVGSDPRTGLQAFSQLSWAIISVNGLCSQSDSVCRQFQAFSQLGWATISVSGLCSQSDSVLVASFRPTANWAGLPFQFDGL